MKIPEQFWWYKIVDTSSDTEWVLTKVSSRVESIDFSEIAKILKNLHKFIGMRPTMIGLALPQIWINKRWFVMNGKTKSGKIIDMIVINPVIEDIWLTLKREKEECISEPWVIKSVQRPRDIEVSYTSTDWKERRKKLSWYEARVFLHEYDHLDWILISSQK